MDYPFHLIDLLLSNLINPNNDRSMPNHWWWRMMRTHVDNKILPKKDFKQVVSKIILSVKWTSYVVGSKSSPDWYGEIGPNFVRQIGHFDCWEENFKIESLLSSRLRWKQCLFFFYGKYSHPNPDPLPSSVGARNWFLFASPEKKVTHHRTITYDLIFFFQI